MLRTENLQINTENSAHNCRIGKMDIYYQHMIQQAKYY